jgi:hypothetical protein
MLSLLSLPLPLHCKKHIIITAIFSSLFLLIVFTNSVLFGAQKTDESGIRSSGEATLGPDKEDAGIIVELNSKAVAGIVGKPKWLFINPPQKGTYRLYENETILAFSTPIEGDYIIVFSFATEAQAAPDNPEKVTEVHSIIHTLRIENGIKPDPIDPDKPEPTPPKPETTEQVVIDEVKKLPNLSEASSKYNATKLISIYRSMAADVENGKVSTIDDAISLTNQKCRDNLGVTFNYWRPVIMALGEHLDNVEPSLELDDIPKVWREIASGIEKGIK